MEKTKHEKLDINNLLDIYAPILVFHELEFYRPISVESIFKGTSVIKDLNKGKTTRLSESEKTEMLNSEEYNILAVLPYNPDEPPDETMIRTSEKLKSFQNEWLQDHNQTVYSHANKIGKHITLTYYFFYLGNEIWKNPKSPRFEIYTHDCDWEMIRVFCEVEHENSTHIIPKSILCARHDAYNEDLLIEWDEKLTIDNHILIFPTLGGHASTLGDQANVNKLKLKVNRILNPRNSKGLIGRVADKVQNRTQYNIVNKHHDVSSYYDFASYPPLFNKYEVPMSNTYKLTKIISPKKYSWLFFKGDWGQGQKIKRFGKLWGSGRGPKGPMYQATLERIWGFVWNEEYLHTRPEYWYDLAIEKMDTLSYDNCENALVLLNNGLKAIDNVKSDKSYDILRYENLLNFQLAKIETERGNWEEAFKILKLINDELNGQFTLWKIDIFIGDKMSNLTQYAIKQPYEDSFIFSLNVKSKLLQQNYLKGDINNYEILYTECINILDFSQRYDLKIEFDARHFAEYFDLRYLELLNNPENSEFEKLDSEIRSQLIEFLTEMDQVIANLNEKDDNLPIREFLFAKAQALIRFGQLEIRLNKREEAEIRLNSSIEIFTKLELPEYKARCLYFLGVVAFNFNDNEDALNHLKDAIKIFDKYINEGKMPQVASYYVTTKTTIGQIYIKKEMYKLALDCFNSTVELANSLQYKDPLIKLYKLIADTSFNLGIVLNEETYLNQAYNTYIHLNKLSTEYGTFEPPSIWDYLSAITLDELVQRFESYRLTRYLLEVYGLYKVARDTLDITHSDLKKICDKRIDYWVNALELNGFEV